jgi:hypothetical protein
MEKLSTECLLGLRERIDNILKERDPEEWETGSETSKDEEGAEFKLWEEYMEEFTKMLPYFIQYKRNFHNRKPLDSKTSNVFGWTYDKVPELNPIKWDKIVDRIIKNDMLYYNHVFRNIYE